VIDLRTDRGTTTVRPGAVALHEPADAPALRAAFAERGIDVQLVDDPADAFAAVVRGAPILVVDAASASASALLRGVRRRIDDGWSECAVIAYFPPGTTVDVELSPLIDAVAIHPLTAKDLDVALRVAAAQREDRHAAIARSAALARSAAPTVAAGPSA
jgi:hypothetical protein